MNNKMKLLALLLGAALFTGCDSTGELLDDNNDIDPLVPAEPAAEDPNRPYPPENAVTVQTDSYSLLHPITGEPFFAKGVSLNYGADPSTRFDAINAIALSGADAIKLVINKDTTDEELELALIEILDQEMLAIVTLTGEDLYCSADDDAFFEAVDEIWLDKLLPIIAQERFQGNMMINIAHGWGPDVFNAASLSYSDYIDNYNYAIRKFRESGFKLPLVIDAPGCGADYRAFMTLRGRSLLNGDPEKNVVLGLNAVGESWDRADKVGDALAFLYAEGVPAIFTGMAGSGVGDAPVDEQDIIDLSWGNEAMFLDIPWQTTSDGLAYYTELDSPLDLRGGQLGFSYYLDSPLLQQVTQGDNVVPTGELTIGAYVRDVNGNAMRLPTKAAKNTQKDIWNSLSEPVNGDNLAEMLVGDATDIDLTQISQIGIEVLANGKAVAVNGVIGVDDLMVFPGFPPMYDEGFESDAGGYQVDDGGGQNPAVLTHDAEQTALSILPQSAQFGIRIFSPDSYGVDFEGARVITVRMMLPSDQTADGKWLQVFGQFGSDWSVWKADPLANNLVPGEWVDLEVTVDWSVDNPGLEVAQAFGIQMGGFAGSETSPVLIDSITIEDPSAKPTVIVQQEKHFIGFSSSVENFQDPGWGGNAIAVTYDEQAQALAITPAVGSEDWMVVTQDTISTAKDLNFVGTNNVSVDVFLPASYSGDNFGLKLQIQGGNNWKGFETPVKGFSEFTPGEWSTLTFTFTDEDMVNYNPEEGKPFLTGLPPQVFGLIFEGVDGLNGETVLVDNISFMGDVEMETVDPVWSYDFESEDAQVSGFSWDATLSTIVESEATAAKFLAYKVIPFTWVADTWFGSDDGLDITNTVDMVDLTDRGQTIVDGFEPPQDTSQPAQ